MRLRRGEHTLIAQLEIAESFAARAKGLLGRQSLGEEQALWIKPSNSIHTFFMKFAIDVIFLDRSLKVRKTFQNVRPGRLILPVWAAASVIELKAGFLQKNPVHLGEQLHVDRSLS
jgi:hypothetical protein